MSFHVGQKVVCVHPVDELLQDAIYRVSRVGSELGVTMIDVAETDGAHPPLAWFSQRFRPLVESKKETDIGAFNAILKRENGHSPIFDPPIRKRKLKHAI
jgi:hypothetical protein